MTATHSEYLEVLRTLREFAEERKAMEAYQDVSDGLGTLKGHLHSIIEAYRQECPNDFIWKMVSTPGPEDGLDSVVLLCSLLEKNLQVKASRANNSPRWHVTKDSEFKGTYEGDVVVDPGATFTLLGCVQGNVLLYGDAKFVCLGCLEGNVIADEESAVEITGSVQGSIRRRGKPLPGEEQ